MALSANQRATSNDRCINLKPRQSHSYSQSRWQKKEIKIQKGTMPQFKRNFSWDQFLKLILFKYDFIKYIIHRVCNFWSKTKICFSVSHMIYIQIVYCDKKCTLAFRYKIIDWPGHLDIDSSGNNNFKNAFSYAVEAFIEVSQW